MHHPAHAVSQLPELPHLFAGLLVLLPLLAALEWAGHRLTQAAHRLLVRPVGRTLHRAWTWYRDPLRGRARRLPK